MLPSLHRLSLATTGTPEQNEWQFTPTVFSEAEWAARADGLADELEKAYVAASAQHDEEMRIYEEEWRIKRQIQDRVSQLMREKRYEEAQQLDRTNPPVPLYPVYGDDGVWVEHLRNARSQHALARRENAITQAEARDAFKAPDALVLGQGKWAEVRIGTVRGERVAIKQYSAQSFNRRHPPPWPGARKKEFSILFNEARREYTAHTLLYRQLERVAGENKVRHVMRPYPLEFVPQTEQDVEGNEDEVLYLVQEAAYDPVAGDQPYRIRRTPETPESFPLIRERSAETLEGDDPFVQIASAVGTAMAQFHANSWRNSDMHDQQFIVKVDQAGRWSVTVVDFGRVNQLDTIESARKNGELRTWYSADTFGDVFVETPDDPPDLQERAKEAMFAAYDALMNEAIAARAAREDLFKSV